MLSEHFTDGRDVQAIQRRQGDLNEIHAQCLRCSNRPVQFSRRGVRRPEEEVVLLASERRL